MIASKVGDLGQDFYNQKCGNHGLTVHVLPDFDAPPTIILGNISATAHMVWRYLIWVERVLIERLRAIHKSNPKWIVPTTAMDYYRLINNKVFLTAGGVEAVEHLYDAYKEHPTLTRDGASELAGHYPDDFHEYGGDLMDE